MDCLKSLEYKFQQRKFFSTEKKRLTKVDVRVAGEIKKAILESKSGLVFDAGCGEGIFTNVIAKARKSIYVVGGDLSKSSLQRAKIRVRGENVDLLLCDVESLPFRSDSFGCIISVGLLHHLQSLNLISEIHRIIRHEGLFFVGDHTYLNNPLFFLFYKFATCLPYEFLKFREDIDPQYKSPHVFMYSFNYLMQALESMGFKPTYIKRDTLFFMPMIVLIKQFSRIFSLSIEGFLNGKVIRTLWGLDDALKKHLYRFCYEFVIQCVAEKNRNHRP